MGLISVLTGNENLIFYLFSFATDTFGYVIKHGAAVAWAYVGVWLATRLMRVMGLPLAILIGFFGPLALLWLLMSDSGKSLQKKARAKAAAAIAPNEISEDEDPKIPTKTGPPVEGIAENMKANRMYYTVDIGGSNWMGVLGFPDLDDGRKPSQLPPEEFKTWLMTKGQKYLPGR